ncbi:MAG: glycosyltransferase family 4 protein [Prevotellaceae bacterium]|jgi:glycosyltransferase involved in cell wall biosynthesis|nr:glycosyltransferase family 4 protein [Prevotellaceae bacterium]
MKISFDAKRAFHNHRGLGVYSRNVIRLLNEFYPENQYFLFNPKRKNNIQFPVNKNTKEINPESFVGKMLPDWWRSVGCIGQIKDLGTDIYHGLSQELPFGIEKTGVKTVVTMHDAIFVRYPELYDRVYPKIFIQKNKYACRVADRIIAVSRQTKSDFIEFFGADASKIDVVYQGCNNIFREKVSEEQKIAVRKKYNLPETFLLNVGAIEKRKNLATIIRAIHQGKIDMPLVACGNKTEYVKEINTLISEYKLENRVFLRYNVDFTDLPAFYALASVFVYPSMFEGFGIPILEALCVGTPVITSRGSCFEETGGKSSLYVHYNNADEMADAIRKVLSDSDLRKKMIVDGQMHAELFTDEKVAGDLMKVYKKVLFK